MAKSKLTPYQQAFVNEYLKCRCKTEAAIKSGYQGTRAAQAGYAMFRRPEVRAEIEARLDAAAEKLNLELEHLLEDAQEVKTRCLQREPVFDENGQPTGEWTFDSRGAIKAIEIQAKLLGLGNEKAEVEHKGHIKVIVEEYKE